MRCWDPPIRDDSVFPHTMMEDTMGQSERRGRWPSAHQLTQRHLSYRPRCGGSHREKEGLSSNILSHAVANRQITGEMQSNCAVNFTQSSSANSSLSPKLVYSPDDRER